MKTRKIIVHKEQCPQDHPCPVVGVCPVGAISQNDYDAPMIDQEKCIACGMCVQYCAYGAFDFA